MPRALLSVSDKTGVVDLGRGLAARGFELVSTGGTARALSEAGLAVTSVSALTGFPEMMDGRVKTLHPAVHGGILARRDHPDDLAAAQALGIGLIDVVVVNLYPFERTAARRDVSFEELVEQIDIGGPSMVRAAAKNFTRRARRRRSGRLPAGCSPTLDDGPTLAFRFELMRKAFAHTGAYDTAIADTLAGDCRWPAAPFERSPYQALGRPARRCRSRRSATCATARTRTSRRPGTSIARARRQAAGLGAASILQGKELSYTNLLDLDAAARIVLEFDEPAAAVIKHTNPCGVATGASAADAYVRAREADPPCGFRRHRRAEPADRRRGGGSHHVDLHRGGDRAGQSSSTRARCSQRKQNMRVVVAALDPELIYGRRISSSDV